MRGGRHEQEMPRGRAELFRQVESLGALDLLAKEVRGELVSFVEDDQVPGATLELGLQVLVAGNLVQAEDELVVVLKGVAAWRGLLQHVREDPELQPEFLEEFIAPLLDQAARGNDEHAAGIGAHDQFADIQAGHDRLACARVIGQDVPQGLPWQHRFLHGRDLVGERLDIGGMDSHHRVEQEGQIHPLGFDRQLKGLAVAVEAPWASLGGDVDLRLVMSA